jgi:hypothetical protein
MAKRGARRPKKERSGDDRSAPASRSAVTGVATAQDVSLVSTEFYQVTPGRQVTIEVATGDDQVSGTSLLLNGMPHPFKDNDGPQPIGTDLDRSMLHARTVVRDVNPSTNHTSVTYELKGGPQTRQYPFAIDVNVEKGSAHYLIAFVFTKEAL